MSKTFSGSNWRIGAFANNKSLISLSLGSNLKEIGEWAFSGLKVPVLLIPISVETIGSDAFYSSTQKTINCEATSKPIGWVNDWYGNEYATVNFGVN